MKTDLMRIVAMATTSQATQDVLGRAVGCAVPHSQAAINHDK